MSGTIDHANITLKFDILQLLTSSLATGQMPLLADWTSLLANGTGAGQASQVYQVSGTLAGSATTNVDLAGSLTNIFGQTITFTKIKLIAVRAASTNNASNLLQVTRPAANGLPWFLAASDGFALNAGGWNVFYDPTGVTVTAGTGDLITLTNSAGTNTIGYDLLIVGAD